MRADTRPFFVQGAAGQLECLLDAPDAPPTGIALLAHPHPLYGGNMHNKVVQMMARAFSSLGYVAARMNFRGVGASGGEHDHGVGETDDMMQLLAHVQTQYPDLPVTLAGYSYGTYVQSRLQAHLETENTPPKRTILFAVPAGQWSVETVPANTVLIHGEADELAPLSAVLTWAKDTPVIVIPACDHFFNRKLHHVENLIHCLCKEG
ncbi:MAG: alpha/beta hydrolase [Burkholderiaceae bacterium]|jgi:alpha/beta superfamily hydrolase|nr:alpha/beta hydrolase [Burkholderiaceae bacterium]